MRLIFPACLVAALLFCCSLLPTRLLAAPPNVLWIISDDLGPELGCYGYKEVHTPHLDALAKDGLVFSKAFSTSPVCSSSRSAFQTGRYQTSIGCYHHLTRDKQALPESLPTAISLMREAGYFISHGVGQAGQKRPAKFGVNYQYDAKRLFDGHDWSLRKPGQPFFAQVHLKEPHRNFVKNDRPRPNAIIPEYYPDHPVTRADWGNYLASIEVLDQRVGAIIKRLKEEGIYDDTLILFFGDHGRPHVRGKQWLYDGGLHTPLIITWPGGLEARGKRDGLASLLDLMPTTLAAAGIDLPNLPGANLLAPDWQGHEMIFAARDRCGDAPDRIRCVRTRDFKYIRNFHPERPYLQLSSYKKLQYPVETLMKVLHAEGKWDSPFMQPQRPREELYDLRNDPLELENLAGSAKYQQELERLRQDLDAWMVATKDRGDADESQVVDMDALMKSKRSWYEKTMKRRGLDPEISDQDYLIWWEKELGVSLSN